MNWGSYLFSFQGRINRAKLWMFILVVIGVEIIYFTAFAVLFGLSTFTAMRNEASAAAGGISIILACILTLVVVIAVFIASLAVHIKRLHDRSKGGIWLLVFYVLPVVLEIAGLVASGTMRPGQMNEVNPTGSILLLAAFGISIWGFVELYCLRGTVGDNQYGSDPLAGQV